ncbi:MAG: PKD domain-containing protein, partial [Thermoplasmata archaeon]|nr:PKD domain-containing protein [Thermoplasmata archaeon]
SMSYDSDGSIVNYTWDFGDGSIAYGCIVNHSYSNDGIYNVTLIVKDDDGDVATIEKQISVASNLPPSIVITNPANGSIVSGIVLIKGNASDDVGIVKVEIRIDGNAWINLTGTTTWQYEWNTTLYENGLHVIEARCYDGFFYAYASIIVNVSNQIDFYYEPANPLSGQPVYFYAPDGDNYTWNFGDGSIAYGRNVSHIFPIGNYYNVSLVVNKNGINMTACKMIRIDTLVTLVKNANNVVNFISWSAPYSIKASELASLIGEPMQKGSVISKWNTSKGSYDDYIVSISPSQYDFVINPGDAIVLRVSSSGSFVMPEVIK